MVLETGHIKIVIVIFPNSTMIGVKLFPNLIKYLFFILFILSCLSDNSLVHEVETIEYETITEIEYVYVEDTAPPPQDTSLDLLPIWVDSFTQPSSMNGIDILWVIDRSGSMTNDAAQIVTGIETMIAALPESDFLIDIVIGTLIVIYQPK